MLRKFIILNILIFFLEMRNILILLNYVKILVNLLLYDEVNITFLVNFNLKYFGIVSSFVYKNLTRLYIRIAI